MKKYNYQDINKLEYKELDSTSSFLKREYDKLDNLTFVSSETQTNGHGRMGRNWISGINENLLFSVLIKNDEFLIDHFDSLSLLSATVVYKTLERIGLKNVVIKWPNDVYVNDKKICGILLEGVSYNDSLSCLIIGIGINVNSKEFGNINATSISVEMNKSVEIDEVKNYIYKEFIDSLNQFKNNNFEYLKIVRENNFLKNKKVYFIKDDIQNEGVVLDINNDNSLKIISNNSIINIRTDEVILKIKK